MIRAAANESPQVSICLASRNETAMLVVTVLSAIESIRAAGVSGEVVVIENSDPAEHAAAMDCLAGQIKENGVRVIREESPSICRALHRAHEEALGEWLFYTDSHCVVGHDTVAELHRFCSAWKDTGRLGFVYSPIQWAHRSHLTKRTHLNVDDMPLGEWAGATPVTNPQRVPWKGMPYMVHRGTWQKIGGLGCCAEHGLGWGVLPYLGMKTWIMGFENWAVPRGTVYHLGEWPESAKPFAQYRVYKTAGRWNGLPRAVALYVYGGEEVLRREYTRCRLERYFRSPDEAVIEARRVGEVERQHLVSIGAKAFDQLFEERPWAAEGVPTISEWYRALNAQLHADGSVRYGYKGADQAAAVIATKEQFGCDTILDYGAGKRTLESALTERGHTCISYDPAIPEISGPPSAADLVVCTDVLEHVEPNLLERVLTHLRSLARKVLFVRVCSVPCTSKKLPDGSDPHRIVQDAGWWETQLSAGFKVTVKPEEDTRYCTFVCTPD